MKKVYCKNCKWFKRDEWNSDRCKRETGVYLENNITGDYKEIITIKVASRNYPNKNGDCEFYLRHWWKVWVRKNEQTIERGM
jgi:hypothetical protein